LNAALCFFRVRFSCSRHRRFVGAGLHLGPLSYFRVQLRPPAKALLVDTGGNSRGESK
jgi:hypothetical protein